MILKVRCPHCGYIQTTRTVKRVKCWNCEKTFKVFYKKRYKGKKFTWASRIVGIVEGTEEELLREFEKLKGKK